MTMLLIMEALDTGKLTLDTPIPVSAEAAGMGGSQVYLKEGETMTVEEMLKCIAVVSANDCCVAMAEAIAGSNAAFIEQMNIKAAELGMTNTHFNSCTGLDTEDHYTTARDIATMSRALMQHSEIQNYTTIWMDSVRNGAFSLSNTNKLVRYYNGATGLKTGFTATAGYCLSATATRDSLSLIAVVLGGETSDKRFEDAKALLNYGFTQYGIYTEPPAQPAPVTVIKGMEDCITPVPAESPAFLVPKGAEKNVTYTVTLPDTVMAPVEAGQKLGTVDYTLDGAVIGSVNLIAEKEVPRVTFSHLFFHLIQYFFVV
jgi:D-alanyl-D-alanine carboxypeptidase (penicillin-binding protein 5/6)